MAAFDPEAYLAGLANLPDALPKNVLLEEALKRKRASLAALEQAAEEARIRQAADQAQYEASTVGRLNALGIPGFERGDLAHRAVNALTSYSSGSSRLVGEGVALPSTLAAIDELALMEQKYFDAENRRTKGEATPEDIELLDTPYVQEWMKTKKASDFLGNNKGTVGGIDISGRSLADVQGATKTAAEKFSEAKANINAATAIREATDFSDSVDRYDRTGLSEDLGKAYKANIDDLSSGYDSFMGGNAVDGIGKTTSALAGLISGAISAGAGNKQATAEYLAENMAQLLGGAMAGGTKFLAATSAAYGLDAFAEGVKEYQSKHGGQLPDEATREKMLMQSAGLILAEYLGDVSVVKGVKSIPGLGNPIDDLAAATVGRTGIIPATVRVAGSGARGAAGEAFAEGTQTYLEGEILGKPATGQQIYEGAAIGGLVGGTASTALNVAREVATGGKSQATIENENAAAEREFARRQRINQAVTLGNKDALLDVAGDAYAPSVVVSSNLSSVLADTSTQESRAADLVSAEALLATVTQHRDDMQETANLYTEENIKQSKEKLDAKRKELAALDPQNTEKAEKLNAYISALESFLNEDHKAERAKAQNKLDIIQKELDSVTKIVGLIRETGTATTTSQPTSEPVAENTTDSGVGVGTGTTPVENSAKNIVIRSMKSPDSLSDTDADALAADTNNDLDSDEREYLKALAESKRASRNIREVSIDIHTGLDENGKTRNVSIKDHVDRVTGYIGSGNIDAAIKAVEQFTNWAKSHTSKAKAMAEARKGVPIGNGKGFSYTVGLNKQTKLWESVPVKGHDIDVTLPEYSSIIPVRSEALVNTVASEAAAMDAVSKQLQATIKLAQRSTAVPAVTEQRTVPTATEKQTAPAVIEEQPVTAGAAENRSQQSEPVAEEQQEEQKEQEEQAVADSAEVGQKADTAISESAMEQEAAQRADSANSDRDGTVDEVVEEDVTNDSSESTPVAEPTIEALNAANPEGTPAVARNNAVFLYQEGNTEGTTKPLVVIKNMLSEMQTNLSGVLTRFVKGEVSDKQQKTIRHFMLALSEWSAAVKASLPQKRKSPEFVFQNAMETLLKNVTQADGTTAVVLDEAVVTAIVYGAYTYVAENAGGPMKATNKQINVILHRDKETWVFPEHRKVLNEVATYQHMLANSIGARIIDALGLKATKDAPANVMPNLKAALGMHAIELLERDGIITRISISAERFNELRTLGLSEENASKAERGNRENALKSAATQYLFKFTRDSKGNLHPRTQNILNANRGSGGIINKLFKAETVQRFPSLKPVKMGKGRIINIAGQLEPSKLNNTIRRNQKRPWKLRLEMLEGLITAFDHDQQMRLFGSTAVDEHTHIDDRDSIEAKNQGIAREWELLLEFVQEYMSESKEAGNADIYLEYDTWKQQRVGIAHSAVNPQTGKVIRELLASTEWTSTIDLDNDAQVNDMYMRIAEGLGYKTEKADELTSINKLIRELDSPKYSAALVALNKLHDTGSISDSDKAVIIKAVQESGSGDLSAYHALLVAAQFTRALDAVNPDTGVRLTNKFVTNFAGYVDGVANGTMFNHLLYGSSVGLLGMAETLAMGGFFLEGAEHTDYPTYRSAPGAKDIYENTAEALLKNVRDTLGIIGEEVSRHTRTTLNSIAKSVWAISGFYDAKADTISSDARGIVKDAVNPMAFGSSLQASVNSMSRAFMDSVRGGFTELSKRRPDNQATKEALDAYQAEVNEYAQHVRNLAGPRMAAELQDRSIDEWLQTSFNSRMVKAITAGYETLMGEPIKKAMEEQFGEFFKASKLMNDGSAAAYKVYALIEEHMRKSYIEELRLKGELGTRTTTVEGKRVTKVIDALSKEQEAVLQERMKPFMPFMATAMSDPSVREEGLFLGKVSKRAPDDPVFRTAVNFGRPIYGLRHTNSRIAPTQMTVVAIVPLITDPGVSTISAGTHSFDSSVIHDVQRNRHILNVHDSAGDSVTRLRSTAIALNKAVFDNAVKYSPLAAMADALNHVVAQFGFAVNKGTISKTDARLIAITINESFSGYVNGAWQPGLVRLANTMQELYTGAVKADAAKLDFLGNLGFINQYALQNGSYEVTEADRAAAKDKRNTVLSARPGYQSSGAMQTVVAMTNLIKVRRNTKTSAEEKIVEAVTAVPNVVTPVAMGETAFGLLGAPKIKPNTLLLDLFANNRTRSAKDVIAELVKRSNKAPANLKFVKYSGALLQALLAHVDDSLNITMITADTAEDSVAGKPDEQSSGWHVPSETGQGDIYFLGAEFVNSNVSAELVIHEILHAVLGNAIEQGKADIKNKVNSPSARLVKEMEVLRSKSRELIKASPDLASKFGHMVENVHEFVSYGLSNESFQREILDNVSYRASKLVKGKQVLDSTVLTKTVGDFFKAIFKFLGIPFSSTQGTQLLLLNTAALLEVSKKITDNAAAVARNNSVRPMAVPNPANMTTMEVFAALDTGTISPDFSFKLQGVLHGIVHKLHGAFGAAHVSMQQNAAVTPMDTWLKAVNTGIAPFAAQVVASPFLLSQQELYVAEQVEATLTAALQHNSITTSAAHSELKRVYMEVRKELKGKISNDQYDYLFSSQAVTSKQDYLTRFVALATSSQELNALMQFNTAPGRKSYLRGATAGEKVQNFFLWLLDAFTRVATGTYPGQDASSKMDTLVSRLVDIEAKRKAAFVRNSPNYLAPVEAAANKAASAMLSSLRGVLQSQASKQGANGALKLVNSAVQIVASKQVEATLEGLQKLRDSMAAGAPGVINSMFSELRGGSRRYLGLMLHVKSHERSRHIASTQTAADVMSTFINGGKGITADEKKAITRVLLRTGAHTLLGKRNLAEIYELLSDSKKLNKAVADAVAALTADPVYGDYYVEQANVLGFHLATGLVKGAFLHGNAHSISRAVGTDSFGKVPAATAAKAEPLIEELITLLAIQYNKSDDLKNAANVLKVENARPAGTGNGVEYLLKLTKTFEQESLTNLFSGNKMQMRHGYSPELVNSNNKVVFAGTVEGRNLQLQGYTKGSELVSDYMDESKDVRNIYVLKGGGIRPYVSGMLSLLSLGAKGTSMDMIPIGSGMTGKQALAAAVQARKAAHPVSSAPKGLRDLSAVSGTFAAPVVDENGNVADFRYMMSHATRDTLLERNNDFSKVMGAYASSIFDKINTPDINATVVDALKADYDNSYSSSPQSFILVGEKSTDPEMLEKWRLLSTETRSKIKAAWGYNGMLVRKEMLDMIFGYRKVSLADRFNREISKAGKKGLANELESLIVEFFLGAMRNYGVRIKGLNEAESHEYAKRFAHAIARGEKGWQEIIHEIKDIVVVKSGIVSLGNITSNLTLLWLNDVPIMDILKYHREGLKGAIMHANDTAELQRLESAVRANYIIGDIKEIEHRIAVLKKAIKDNPVTKLVELGLMPTIVEDIASDEDIFSYKTGLTQWVESKTEWVNPSVKKAVRGVYMAHDTKLYQGFSRVTQLSDFVARYALFQHLTTRKENPLSETEAQLQASESFVNYDIPMHRLIQYTDDMGLTPFMKYFLRVQATLARSVQDAPAKAILLSMLGQMTTLPVVLDSSVLAKVGNNPVSSGVFQYPSAVGDIATIAALH